MYCEVVLNEFHSAEEFVNEVFIFMESIPDFTWDVFYTCLDCDIFENLFSRPFRYEGFNSFTLYFDYVVGSL